MTATMDETIEPQFRIIDGLSIRFAESEDQLPRVEAAVGLGVRGLDPVLQAIAQLERVRPLLAFTSSPSESLTASRNPIAALGDAWRAQLPGTDQAPAAIIELNRVVGEVP